MIGRTISSWSLISCNAPLSCPSIALSTWPATSSTGDEHAYAVPSAADAFWTPGPGTTRATPGFPATRAYPSAMYTVVCSCRTVSSRMSVWPQKAS